MERGDTLSVPDATCRRVRHGRIRIGAPVAERDAPTIPNLVEGLERSIREMSIELPVDIAGNSLGGWMAVEAARRGIARSVVAISDRKSVV